MNTVFQNHTDIELSALLHERNERAFHEIYQRYHNKLFSYAHARINSREDCKELVQEVFEVAWKNETYIRKLAPYLFTIMKFRIINYYEHKTVKHKFSEHMKLYTPEPILPEEESEIELLRQAINQSIANLPERCQDALKLRIDANLSLDAIAVHMNVTKESVKRYLTMAMNHFRKHHKPIYKMK